jgi:catechol 2,3-dioxygenase-like lactoylglutathione lyase family enzyme
MPAGRTADHSPTLGPLGQVSLLVRSVDRAVAFYRETLGLPYLYAFGPLAFFDLDGTRLFLRAVPDAEWQPASILYFLVSDLRVAHASLAARGVSFSSGPERMHRHEDGTEEWMAFFADPDGNVLALMSRVRPGTPAQPTSER